MALSCVLRMERGGRRFGAGMVADVLAGSNTQKIRQAQLDQNPCYGLMKAADKREISAFLARLVQDGLLRATEGEYPVLCTTELSHDVLRGEHAVMQRREGPLSVKPKKTTKKKATRKAQPQTGTLVEMPEAAAPERMAEDPLMQELRALRMQIAREINRPPFLVFSDATLRDMAEKRPLTPEQLDAVSGVGAVKRERYGERFINVIAKHSGFDGTHRRMACRAAVDVLLAHRDEWLRGLSPEQAQDAYDHVLRLLEK